MGARELKPLAGSLEERAQFEALQTRLADHHRRFRADPTQPYTAVVVPSQSVDPRELAKIEGVAHYEERSLFNLMLLRHPRLRLIFVSSKRINPLIVDYYLHQMRGVPSAHARRRLELLDCDDASPRPLTEKLLERPLLMERLKELIGDPSAAHLTVFNSSGWERTLSVQLGIPLYGCNPELNHLGSKTGSRRVFRDAGLELIPGREGLRDFAELTAALAELWGEAPEAKRVVVKLDESFSGEGNAVLDLPPGGAPTGAEARRSVIEAALPTLRFEAAGLGFEEYRAQFDQMGGICELWIEGEGKTAPSVQMRINPAGEVQVVSTHDQVLGGPSGQIFIGATFPAAAEYRLELQEIGRAVGRVLADRGAIGRFGVDVLALPEAERVALYPIEINLRQGGTTHPFNTLKFITDGQYDEESGRFFTAQGRERCYFATDNLSSPEYRGILPFDLIDRLVLRGVHFRADETGVLFHLLGCLSEFGKVGCTSVGATLEDAKRSYERTVSILEEMAR